MLHQFIQSYNILTVIFHFSHLSICFPTWYQQSNGGRRKKCFACAPSNNCLSESLMGCAQTKARSRRPQLTDPRFALWRRAGEIRRFSLQIWDIWNSLCCRFACADVISPSGGTFPLQPQESWVPSPCNLQAGPFLPSSPQCLSIMQHVVTLNRFPKYLHKQPEICKDQE